MPTLDKTEPAQKPPVRVLFVMGALDGGGAEKVLTELLRDFDRTRIQASLFLMWRRGIYLSNVPADVSLTWGVEGDQQIRKHLPSFLRTLLRSARPCDVIVGGVELLPSYFAWLAATIWRKPVVGWVHTDLDGYIQHQPLWDRSLARLLYPHFDNVVALTETAADSVHRSTGADPKRLCVIPNYVDIRAVVQLAAEPVDSWAAPIMAKPFIMGLGRLVNKDKGWDVLLRAHALVSSQGVDHNFVVIGEGEDRQCLEELARELKVQDSFFLPGYQRNPFPVVKQAVALVAGSKLEGFGLALVEAMALGVPVIACARASGPATILGGGRHGVLTDADDAGEFAAAISDLLTNPAKREDYSRRALLRAQHYDVKIGNEWETLLSSLV